MLRLWARQSKIKRAVLSSYAITLMAIYALQHATPPVLPCLQDPRGWPKNMEWFGTQGFSGAAHNIEHSVVEVGGWSCAFTPPGSLQPSQNSASVGEYSKL